MSGLALPILVAIFALAAAAIWIAGIALSNQTDVLSTRLHLGAALGGVILLAVATNLPEIAIVASAALSDDLSVAVGNILGGIAIQTVVLVALDRFGGTPNPLTYRAASLTLVLEGLLVVAILGAVIAGTQLPASLITARLTPDVVIITVLWLGGLLLLQRAGRGLPWHQAGQPPNGSPNQKDTARPRPRPPPPRRGPARHAPQSSSPSLAWLRWSPA